MELPANDHGHDAPPLAGERRARIVVALTTVTMVAEIAAGAATGSLALLADGWHMATHVAVLLLTSAAYWYARTRSRSSHYSFGTGKVYALAGYTGAVLLGGAAVFMVVESIERLTEPHAIAYDEALVVASIGLVVNAVCAWLLHGAHGHDHAHHHHAHHDHDAHGRHAHGHDHNLRAAYLHVLADALTSVLAIIALIAGKTWGWTFLDPATALVGAAVILWWGIGLSVSSARQLLDASPSIEAETKIRGALESVEGVEVLDLHVWELGPRRRACVASVVSSTLRPTSFYRQQVLASVPIAHLTVEVHQLEASACET